MTEMHVHNAVREKYGAIAKAVGKTGGCCGPTACGCGDPITSDLYSDAETKDLPPEEIIRRFSAKEAEFAKARENYTYRQSLKIQELSSAFRCPC